MELGQLAAQRRRPVAQQLGHVLQRGAEAVGRFVEHHGTALAGQLLQRRAALEELTGERRTMVFHEAPHRLRATLEDMAELLGDRPAALCRELTKLHEDTVRTTLSQAAEWYRTNEPRGEYVLVVAGREKQDAPPMTLEEGVARVLALREGGMKLKDAVRRVSDDTGLPRNALYDAALKA